MKRRKYESVDDYIRPFPRHIRKKLVEIREIVREEAPQAEEKISYQMPAYSLNGNLVYFAGYTGHIGFYPTASGIRAFKSKLAKYKNAKGSVQFPMDEPLPRNLIKAIVKFRVKENMKKEQ